VALRDAAAAWHVHAAWGDAPGAEGIVFADPRLAEAGWRILAPAPLPADADARDYDRHRLALGLPDGSADMEAEKSVLLEAGFDELHGVSWSKGCFMGQELTARTRYRGLVKRRLIPVEAAGGPLPPRGTPLTDAAGAEVGEMRSGRDGVGLALLRIDALDRAPFAAGGAALTPRIPAWMRLPAKQDA
jgi:folate-binding protein YgfZ